MKYQVQTIHFNTHSEDPIEFTVEAKDMAQAETFADAYMTEHYGQECYSVNTTITAVKEPKESEEIKKPDWQDRRFY